MKHGKIVRRREGTVEVIGELEWDARPGATYEVHLDVAAGHRRRGVGRSMMDEIETLAKSRGAVSLYTFMAGDNELAQAFFLAMGFTLSWIPGFYGEGRNAWFGVKTIGRPK